MNVEIKSNSDIYSELLGWLPSYLSFLFVLFITNCFIAMYIIKSIIGLDTTQYGLEIMLSSIVLSLGIFMIYLKWLINSLLNYKLSFDNENIIIKGMSGWKNINEIIPVNTISRICIGDPNERTNKVYDGYEPIKANLATRLSIIKINGDIIKLELACKVFKAESLYKFLGLLKSHNIETNVNV